MRPARGVAVCIALLIAGTLGAATAFAETPSEQREAAVLKARAGHMAEAEAALRAMLAAGIDDHGLVAMDLATLLQQDGKAAEAVAVFEKAALAEPPDYALLAATRAYRDLGRYADAERLARQGLQRFVSDSVWPMLLSLILSDEGRTADALAVLKTPAAGRSPPLERLLAEAYAWRRAGDPTRALKVYGEAMRQAPANHGVKDEAAGVMRDMGAPFGAEQIAGPTPAIRADEAAARVRWGTQTRPSDPAHRFDGTDAALADLDRQLAALPPPPAESGLRRKLRLDRMVALRDRVRMQEAVDEGAALEAEGPLPQYAEEAYADALLYLRRPEAARAHYDKVLSQSPKDVAATYGRFYASVELEDFAAAYAAVDSLVESEPVWRVYANDPSRYSNDDRVYAEVTAAQARFYGNQLSEAWARITKISDAAPTSAQARMALYQIANARGWPNRAREEGEIAIGLAPNDVDAKIARIEIAMADYRFKEAQRLMADLLTQYPENTAVQRLARELDAKTRWLFEGEVKPGNSNGGGANASGQELNGEAKLTSPPIADHWQVFALGQYANAHPPEGFVDRERLGAGLEYRIPEITAALYPTWSWGTLPRAGGVATLDWLATDQLRVAFAADFYSWDTPLRAVIHGISADEYSAKVEYRWSESRSVAATFAYLPFTDTNQRLAGGLSYKEKVVNLPHFDLTALADAYVSSNNLQGAPYYNPTRDLSLTGGFMAEHTLWRRYDNSLVQALTVEAGLYSEYSFSDNWIGSINYEHRWRFDPLTEFHYGVLLSRRVYDGSVEDSIFFTIGLRQRI